MKKTITVTFPATPDRVAAMLADPAYQQLRVDRIGLDEASVDVAAQGEGFVSTIAGKVPTSLLPASVKRFVPSSPSFTLAETWSEPAGDGARTGSVKVDVKGAPVRAGATTALRPTGDATEVSFDVELKVSVPIVGGTIEEKVMARADRAIADEEARGTAWLAEH